MKDKNNIWILYLSTAVFAWSLCGVTYEKGKPFFTPFGFFFGRSGYTIVLLALVFFFKREHWVELRESWKDRNKLLWLAVVMNVHLFTSMASFAYTSIGSAVFINCTYVWMIAIFSREKLSRTNMAWMVSAIFGLAILVFDMESVQRSSLFGNVLALIGAATFAYYNTFMKDDSYNTYTNFSWIMGIGMLAMLAFYALPFLDTPITKKGIRFVEHWPLLIYALINLVGHRAYHIGVLLKDKFSGGMFNLGQPVLSLVWAIVIANQATSMRSAIGMMLIMLSLVGHVWTHRPKNTAV